MFEGPRVSLKAIDRDDAAELYRIAAHPELRGRRYLHDEERPLSLTDIERHLEELQEHRNALHLKVVTNEELIGYATVDYGWDPLTPHMDVVISPDHQRAGYGSETARLLIDWVFATLPATTIHSWVVDWNQPALRFAASLGFVEAGRVRRDGVHNGHFSDSIPVELLREEASHAD